ncbi:MAG: hypothetical protein PHT69_13835, partial [Bacteroidales bacterium]|nr:hypothetical protein [Bacteroidales bacterium]
MKSFVRHIILLLIWLSCNQIYGQTAYSSEKDLIKNAELLFKNENYVAALPLYSQLLSLYPRDHMYNYKFGVCMLMADKRDMLKPLQYLEFAVQLEEIPPEAYYYLGLAYHYNYRFSEAIRAYNTFLQKSSRRLQSKL